MSSAFEDRAVKEQQRSKSKNPWHKHEDLRGGLQVGQRPAPTFRMGELVKNPDQNAKSVSPGTFSTHRVPET
jgi:hypothetical protein